MPRWIGMLWTLVLLWALPVAAQTANSVITPQTITSGMFSFVQGTHAADTLQTIFTPAGAGGARCNGFLITNNSSTTHALTLVMETTAEGATTRARTLATLTTASNQGYVSGTPGITPLTTAIMPGLPVDSNNNAYLVIKGGDTLRMKYATTLPAATRIDMYLTCVNF